MPHNFVADGFRTKKLCSRLSSKEVQFLTENGQFAFWGSRGAQCQRTPTMFSLGSLKSAWWTSISGN